MKKALALGTVLALIGAAATAGKDGQNPMPSVTVYISNNAGTPAPVLDLARLIARSIFVRAGVHLGWQVHQSNRDAARQIITIDITSRTPENLHPGALAYAQMHEGVHIRVFYDRVESMADGSSRVPAVLAHVLVHEITHILEGVCRHSQEGIMKAHWTPQDLWQMARGPLPLDPSDLRLIQLGLMRRCDAENATIAFNRQDKSPIRQ